VPGILSVDLACVATNIGLCVLQSESGTVWRAHFVPFADWNLPTSLIPTTLADLIYDFCVREHISIVILDGPQGWKDPESSLPHCRECERALNTPAKTGLQGIVKPAPYTSFVEFSIAVFARLVQRGATLASDSLVPVPPGVLALESFPNAARKKLGIKPLPAKSRCKPVEIAARLKELTERFQIETPDTSPTHDQLQALVTAIAGRAILQRESGAYLAQGVPPSIKNGTIVEGFIINPTAHMIRVFQYGSNTLPARLNGPTRLCGRAQTCGLAQTFDDFDIAFDVQSKSNGCAASDLVSVAGRKAWGVLYEIPDGFVFGRRKDEQKTLAQIEGPRYEPREITVVDTRGKQSNAWTFLVNDEDKETGLATSAAYVSWIVYGLRQNGVPEDYISHVIEVARETNRHACQDATEQNRLIDNI
jgi:hypothetical protein